jgi:hypothetical protein
MSFKKTPSNSDSISIKHNLMTIGMFLSKSNMFKTDHIGEDFLASPIYLDECAMFKTSSKARIKLMNSKTSKTASNYKKSDKDKTVVSKFQTSSSSEGGVLKPMAIPSFDKKTDLGNTLFNNTGFSGFKSSIFGGSSTSNNINFTSNLFKPQSDRIIPDNRTSPTTTQSSEGINNFTITELRKPKKHLNCVKLEIEKITGERLNSDSYESK